MGFLTTRLGRVWAWRGVSCKGREGGDGGEKQPGVREGAECSQASISRAVTGVGLSFASARADTPSRGQVEARYARPGRHGGVNPCGFRIGSHLPNGQRSLTEAG